jgi:hydrogenase nickel incorporation protein HypA/HybF
VCEVEGVHELAIAQSILEQVSEITESQRLGRVQTIHLRVGALRAVVPECLTLGFEAVSRGTPLEGAQIEVAEVPVTLECHSCGQAASPASGVAWICPACGSPDVEVAAGKELVLESLDVED